MFRYVIYGCALLAALSGLSGCVPKPGREPDQGPSPARKPTEERASFRLPPGLQIQLVAAEPMVQDPVVITFDPDGRLWVVEMRGFMTDIEGKGEKEPTGRVSVLEDTDGDGKWTPARCTSTAW
jgi:glucose/arabinose dehydrogenase